jgi:hypothetical protein
MRGRSVATRPGQLLRISGFGTGASGAGCSGAGNGASGACAKAAVDNAQKTNAVTARCWMLAGADRRRRFKSSLFRRAFRQCHQKRQISMDYGAKFLRGRLFILPSPARKRESGAGTVVAPRVTDRWSLGNLRG